MSLESELERRRADAGPVYLAEIAGAARQLVAAGMPARGKRVGQRAPDFALAGPDGQPVGLPGLLRSGPVVVSVFRGEWCPFCRAELEALLAAQPAMARLGATLLLISPEPPSAALAARVAGLAPRAYLLRDPTLGVALLYGLVYLVPDPLRQFYIGRDFDLSRDLSTGSWLLPLPADFVIDSDGTIALSYIEADFTRRLDPRLIVETLDRLLDEA